jgi:uncharacterized membrane protein
MARKASLATGLAGMALVAGVFAATLACVSAQGELGRLVTAAAAQRIKELRPALMHVR